ncbi:unnamed protein product [Cylindrotheca closterium]|uniref:Uncharacterized protein n=1 Tax=Cylindrotheca closterium TaxID=2856 RepID=A0AAD2G6F0_9STRA|nr:unnamed protein product [Cylindrotheca closterium]
MNNQRINNNDERPKATSTIPPPLPPFRSVRMNVGPAPVMVQPQSFGAKAPPMMPGASSFGAKHGQGKTMMAPPKPMGFASSGTAMQNNSISTSSNSKFVWKVDALQTVPVYHPLERTAVTFGNEHTLDMITQRISNFMKEQSIHCDYDDAMARVVCSTACCLFFSVQLWQKAGSIVMEMQRKQGCAIYMQSLRQQLKDCILFGEQPNKTQDVTCPPALKQQLARMIPAIPAAVEQEQGSCIDLCQEMLASNFMNHQRMGLESLCILTDASKVQCSLKASEKVLQDSKLQELLLNYVEDQQQASLHLLAVKAVSQALESTATNSGNLKIDLGSVFWHTVLQALYQHIQRPHEKPLEAALAIKALRLLQLSNPECLQVLQRKHSLPVTAFLQIAHEFGKQHSASLESEAQQFMMSVVH